ncbi:MAG: hypothetical protein IKZ51_03715 [Bacteroidales bacterium]|nr:hypothetical protein [Bacteroidales bacterium]
MKRFLTILACLTLAAAAWGQTDAAGFKARYDRQTRIVGNAGVGVETILDRWEEAYPDDPAMFEGRYMFWLAKSMGSTVVAKDKPRYLGNEPVLTLKDSTGTDVFYFEDNVFTDSLFAKSQSAIDRAIALEPDELGYRVDKITALMLYEKDSPDMATQELLKLIGYQKSAKPEWTYYGLPVDEDSFKNTIQEYCYNFFRYATPGSYEAFRTVSEAMLKLYPRDTDFMNNLGSYWLVCKQNNRKALQWYNKVLKINPKDYTAAKNCVILARKDNNVKLEKKYLPVLIEATDSETERRSSQLRLESLSAKKKK